MMPLLFSLRLHGDVNSDENLIAARMRLDGRSGRRRLRRIDHPRPRRRSFFAIFSSANHRNACDNHWDRDEPRDGEPADNFGKAAKGKVRKEWEEERAGN